MDFLIEGFRVGLEQMTLLEAIAVVFGLASVWFARLNNILVYPTGIVSVVIDVYICAGAKLYADMGINAYYFVMSVYGWWFWSRKTDDTELVPITKNDRSENISSMVIGVVSFFSLWWVLSTFTDSDVPVWDSLTTAFFFVGMWLMAKKKLENWTAWIIADFISIPLYFYKGLILTSFQYLVFLILAILGYIAWNKNIRQRSIA